MDIVSGLLVKASSSVTKLPYFTNLEGRLGVYRADGTYVADVVAERSEVIVVGLPPLIVPAGKGGFLDAVVAHVEEVGSIFVQLKNETQRILDLCASLQRSYSQENTEILYNPFKGQLCAAKFEEDSLWYRALVLDRPEPLRFKILFIDYGNMSMVTKDCIKVLQKPYMEIPPMAVRIVMIGMAGIPSSKKDLLKRSLGSRDILLNLESHEQNAFIGTVQLQVESKEGSVELYPIHDVALGRVDPPPPDPPKGVNKISGGSGFRVPDTRSNTSYERPPGNQRGAFGAGFGGTRGGGNERSQELERKDYFVPDSRDGRSDRGNSRGGGFGGRGGYGQSRGEQQGMSGSMDRSTDGGSGFGGAIRGGFGGEGGVASRGGDRGGGNFRSNDRGGHGEQGGFGSGGRGGGGGFGSGNRGGGYGGSSDRSAFGGGGFGSDRGSGGFGDRGRGGGTGSSERGGGGFGGNERGGFSGRGGRGGGFGNDRGGFGGDSSRDAETGNSRGGGFGNRGNNRGGGFGGRGNFDSSNGAPGRGGLGSGRTFNRTGDESRGGFVANRGSGERGGRGFGERTGGFGANRGGFGGNTSPAPPGQDDSSKPAGGFGAGGFGGGFGGNSKPVQEAPKAAAVPEEEVTEKELAPRRQSGESDEEPTVSDMTQKQSDLEDPKAEDKKGESEFTGSGDASEESSDKATDKLNISNSGAGGEGTVFPVPTVPTVPTRDSYGDRKLDCPVTVKANVVVVDGVDSFFMNLVEDIPVRDSMAEAITAYGEPKKVDKLSVGALCTALWEEDWYRGRILSCEQDGEQPYVVHFVDFGNSDVYALDEVHELPRTEKLQNTPELAIQCEYYGVTPKNGDAIVWSDPALDYLSDLVEVEEAEEERIPLEVEFVEKRGEKYAVRITTGAGKSVTKELVKAGFANLTDDTIHITSEDEMDRIVEESDPEDPKGDKLDEAPSEGDGLKPSESEEQKVEATEAAETFSEEPKVEATEAIAPELEQTKAEPPMSPEPVKVETDQENALNEERQIAGSGTADSVEEAKTTGSGEEEPAAVIEKDVPDEKPLPPLIEEDEASEVGSDRTDPEVDEERQCSVKEDESKDDSSPASVAQKEEVLAGDAPDDSDKEGDGEGGSVGPGATSMNQIGSEVKNEGGASSPPQEEKVDELDDGAKDVLSSEPANSVASIETQEKKAGETSEISSELLSLYLEVKGEGASERPADSEVEKPDMEGSAVDEAPMEEGSSVQVTSETNEVSESGSSEEKKADAAEPGVDEKEGESSQTELGEDVAASLPASNELGASDEKEEKEERQTDHCGGDGVVKGSETVVVSEGDADKAEDGCANVKEKS